MKSTDFLLLALFVTTIGTAQEWHTDFDTAKELATKENKTIVLVFQGSDCCGPCIKLDRTIWSTEEFKAYAKDHYVMLQADFPRRKKNALSPDQTAANAKLADRYNKNGVFPFVVVLDEDGKTLGETGYKKVTPKEYIETLNSLKG
jgi:thioredoxin-related protein